jgi:CubicO group peptidase (beta-lactamase class C family)
VEVHGTVADGFGRVAEAFAANFAERGEVGAALGIYVDGALVVDVWAGTAHPHLATDKANAPWQEDTLQCVYSSTKAITGLAVAMLVERGVLDYDEPVATYWPEFGQQGKERITLRQILSHTAGLPLIDAPLSRDDLGDLDKIARALETQAPLWEPGTRHGYGAFTIGFYPAEVIRRIDGRTVGAFVSDEISAPLGAEFWIGLPEEHEHRVSTVVPFDFAALDLTIPTFAAFADPDSYMSRGMANPSGLLDFEWHNSRAFHSVELPAANGITTARSFARIYAALAGGGELDGVRLLSEATLADATRTHASGIDEVYRVPTAWALGFFNPSEGNEFSENPRAFGHAGIGGSIGFADPDRALGFGYAMNQLGTHNLIDPRPRAIVEALHRVI